MTLATQTFKFYEESALTNPVAALDQLIHQTDLSDNPQDSVVFYGSQIANRQLEATSNPGVDDILITPTNIRSIWVATTAYALGDSVEPTTPNTRRYECTTAGTSDGSEPTFPTGGLGSTVADGTVVWTLVSLVHATTEIKLAATSGGLAAATPGAALSLGTVILSGSGNGSEINIRITNAVVTVESTVGKAGIGVNVNNVTEGAQ